MSSPDGREDGGPESCVVVLPFQDKAAEYCDWIERETWLTVDSLRRVPRFFFTYGSYGRCSVVEMSVKEKWLRQKMDKACLCERLAVAETYAWLAQNDTNTGAA